MSSNSKDEITRLLAILGSIVVVVGVNAPCVWIGSFFINPSRKPVLPLAAADWKIAIAILSLTGIICGATFVKSHRAIWLWLGSLLLAAAIAFAWWRLNSLLNTRLHWLLNQRPNMPGFKMLWGWAVLAAGGLLQIVTAVWASFCAFRRSALPADVAAPPDQPPVS
jgi:hypothetical protein